MIERNTVFVLGAGASEPYGFPLGRALVDEAIRVLRNPGDLRGNLLQEVCGVSRADLRAFTDGLERAASPSIDAFLESRRDINLDLGKAVIAALLIPYEHENELFTRENNSDNAKRRARRWYDYVLNRMGATRDDFRKNRLSVLTFNYDRSFEQFMLVALQHRHGITAKEAGQLLVDTVSIEHLHGQLGSLPDYGHATNVRPYAQSVTPDSIRLSAQAISVVHEDIDSHSQFQRARDLLLTADQIWFLGFGYYPVNVERLGKENFIITSARNVGLWGTAYGLASAERVRVLAAVNSGLNIGGPEDDVLTFLRERWV